MYPTERPTWPTGTAIGSSAASSRSSPVEDAESLEEGHDPPIMAKNPPPPSAETFYPHRARKLIGLIDKVLLKRTQLEYQTATWLRNHSFLNESAGALSVALTAITGENVTQTQLDHALRLRAQHREDCETIQNQMEMFRDMQSSLSNLEYRLADEEDALLHSLRTSAEPDLAFTTDIDSQEGRTAVSTKSDTPTLVNLYFERKGDEAIYMERLQELDISYSEGLVERELVNDRGDPLPITDEQYARDYLGRRTTILSDLASAQTELADLRTLCDEAGLDTQVRSHDSFDHEAPLPDSPAYHAELSPLMHNDTAYPLNGRGASTNRSIVDSGITVWMESISTRPSEHRQHGHATAASSVQSREPTEIIRRDSQPWTLSIGHINMMPSESDERVLSGVVRSDEGDAAAEVELPLAVTMDNALHGLPGSWVA
ncbi:hypothetical protein LTS10_005233 [Elasticomyces elasticus]|nr:hypothetical protein LTS10_005233 [Elasticomyces elasticus]